MLAAGLHLELFSGRDAWARARPRGVLERRRETRKWTPALTPKLIVCVRCFYLLSAMLRRTSSIVPCRRSGSALSKALVPSEVRRPRGVVDDLRRCGPFPLISTSRALDLRRRRVAGPRIRTLRGGVPSCGRPRPRPSESLSTIEAPVGASQFSRNRMLVWWDVRGQIMGPANARQGRRLAAFRHGGKEARARCVWQTRESHSA